MTVKVDLYNTYYDKFAADVQASVRAETYGEDIGQSSWMTAEELRYFIALKVEDGDDKRARPVIAVKLLKQLGILGDDDLSELSPMPIKNRRGDAVGRVETSNNLLNLI